MVRKNGKAGYNLCWMYCRIEGEDIAVYCSTSHAQKVSQGRTKIKVGVGIYILQETLRGTPFTQNSTQVQSGHHEGMHENGWTDVRFVNGLARRRVLGQYCNCSGRELAGHPRSASFCCFVLGRKPSSRLMRPCDFVVSQTPGFEVM